MASFLYISEYAAGNYAGIQAALCPPIRVQPRIDFSGGVQQSLAFTGDTRMIEVACDTVCSVHVGGTNPVATTDDTRFFIGRVTYYIVVPGDKLSVIANT